MNRYQPKKVNRRAVTERRSGRGRGKERRREGGKEGEVIKSNIIAGNGWDLYAPVQRGEAICRLDHSSRHSFGIVSLHK